MKYTYAVLLTSRQVLSSVFTALCRFRCTAQRLSYVRTHTLVLFRVLVSHRS